MHPRRQVLPFLRSQRCKLLLLGIAVAAWLCPSSLLAPASARAPASALQGGWQAYPRVELITRTYADRYFALLHILLPSTLLFWPWAAAPLTLVLDAESAKDREMGVLLAHMHPALLRVRFSALPSLPGIFEGAWRTKGGVGYDRQQRDTLLLDLHASEGAEVLCIIDTDAAFITAVSPAELFAARSSSGGAGGRPWRLRVKGSALVTDFENATARALGLPFIADFMAAFPVCVYRAHLPLFRAHLVRAAAANFASGAQGGSANASGLLLQPPATFDEAVRALGSFYSQFTLLGNYLFHFHRDDYEWHLQGYQRRAGHPAADYDLSTPTLDLAKHLEDEADPRGLLLEGLCHSTQYLASPSVCADYEGRVHEQAHSFQLEGPPALTEPWETSALPLHVHHARHYQRLWAAQPPRAPANYRDPSGE